MKTDLWLREYDDDDTLKDLPSLQTLHNFLRLIQLEITLYSQENMVQSPCFTSLSFSPLFVSLCLSLALLDM